MGDGNRLMEPALDLLELRAALQQHLQQQGPEQQGTEQQGKEQSDSDSSSGSWETDGGETDVDAEVAFVRCPIVRSALILVLAQALLLCPKQKVGFVSLKLMAQLALKVCGCGWVGGGAVFGLIIGLTLELCACQTW